MTFTDDDLKRLKEAWSASGEAEAWLFYSGFKKATFDALLARLLDAEKACQFMYISAHSIDDASEEAYQAWRKSKEA